MREIMFRSWDNRNKVMDFPDSIANDIDGDKYAIMQYTGLKDKNGVEIFEGDCLKWQYWREEMWGDKGALEPDIGVICYQAPCFIWEWFRLGKKLKTYGEELEIGNPKDYEVIGNIYENPELLGESNADR